MTDIERYIEFLKFSLDDARSKPSHEMLKDMDWEGLLLFAEKQSIIGVVFRGIQRLDKSGPRPTKYQIINWVGICEQIKEENKTVNRNASLMTYRLWKNAGFKGCLLKGQGNALMYPDPYMRTPGDIDLWLKGDRVAITKYVRERVPEAEINYHHVQFPVLSDTAVEIHFTPSFCGNLFYDRRLQRYFREHESAQFKRLVDLPDDAGKICVPCDDFNRIFQMSHMMHHFFFEGIGLRQMIDYYYLLKRGFTEEERLECVRQLRRLNMTRFAGAVMYVMVQMLGLDQKFCLLPPNRRAGKLLEKEILEAGNFGHHDERYDFKGQSRMGQYLLETKRNLRFALYYPAETVFGRPIWRVWHQYFKWKAERDLKR